MKDLSGKVAVVTGGGSGIGRGTVLALAGAGMHVVVADIDESAAIDVAAEASALGPKSIAVRTDVTDLASVEALAEAAYGEFGAVHVLHNNAGVLVVKRLDAMTPDDWRWVLSINLQGVVNGLLAFLPRLKSQDGERHIVNTASMAGMIAGPGLGAYNATKFAIVAISETLHVELSGEGIGVSVLCPGGVATRIFEHAAQQGPEGAADLRSLEMEGELRQMMDPLEVGERVRQAIVDDELYIFTHPEFERAVRSRVDRIFSAFERAPKRKRSD